MSEEKKQELVNYWSVYWAINKHKFWKNHEFIDKNSGKKMSYEFVGGEVMRKSVFLQVFSSIMWLSPVLLVVLVSILYIPHCIMSIYIGMLVIIAYHFAAMYYVIRGPHIQISPIKKKWLFSRK